MQRIAIIKPSALGDIVHALPVLGVLRRKWPTAHLTWIVNKSFEPLIANHKHLNATLAFDRNVFKGNPAKSLQYSWQFANHLRQQRFDLVIDLQGLLRTGLMTVATGAPVKVGFANAREGAARFYTHHVEVPDTESIHAVDRYLRVTDYLGCERSPMHFDVPVSLQERDSVQHELAALPRPWITVAVGAKWTTKRWPPLHFSHLLKQGQDAFGGTVLFTGTVEDTADSQIAAQSLTGPYRDFTGKTSLPRLTALFASSDLMIGNDTGPLHLAAALGLPCVAPYTCTKVVKHGPYGQDGGVETSVACGGSYLKNCPNGLACFAELTPDRLWPTLQGVLQSWATRYRSA
ncbi:lipopolysaccharide heptosyltransferase I [soil metagenome]